MNTTENAADIGSRDMSVTKISNKWPSDIKTKATAETEKEARIMKDMITSTTLKSDVMEEILQRYSNWKFFRISSWMQRVLHNCNKLKLERQSWPLTTKEIESSEILWVKKMQSKIQDTLQFKDDAEKLNLQLGKTCRILNLQALHCT